MRIDSVGHAVPETVISNEQAFEMFASQNRRHYTDDEWRGIERHLRLVVKAAGTRKRHVAMNGESAIDIARKATKRALDEAGKSPDEIDLIVYSSIARGWLEPCMAIAIQKEIGASNATCFDVLDACAGWLRATHVVHGMLQSGTYENALLVSLECGMFDYVRFDLPDADAARRYAAAMTLGEAATATVLTRSSEDDFFFLFKTFADDYELCLLPLDNAHMYAPALRGSDLLARKFTADTNNIVSRTVGHIVDTFKATEELQSGSYDAIFSHAASMLAGHIVVKELNLSEAAYHPTHGDFGNTASASVPLAISLAAERGQIKRGDKVLIVVGSAGITVGFATFTY
jgi:3-oxoacyl-[acyl-carrier-protein] synthase III